MLVWMLVVVVVVVVVEVVVVVGMRMRMVAQQRRGFGCVFFFCMFAFCMFAFDRIVYGTSTSSGEVLQLVQVRAREVEYIFRIRNLEV